MGCQPITKDLQLLVVFDVLFRLLVAMKFATIRVLYANHKCASDASEFHLFSLI